MADEPVSSVEIDWSDDEIIAATSSASFEGLQLAAQHLLQEATAIVPHEEGELERSGDTDDDEDEGVVSVFFDRPYAVIQHEMEDFKHDEGRSWKYLEIPMHTEKETMLELIASVASEVVD